MMKVEYKIIYINNKFIIYYYTHNLEEVSALNKLID
jgi:hypothetical protein